MTHSYPASHIGCRRLLFLRVRSARPTRGLDKDDGPSATETDSIGPAPRDAQMPAPTTAKQCCYRSQYCRAALDRRGSPGNLGSGLQIGS
jgi:hypothetical protein